MFRHLFPVATILAVLSTPVFAQNLPATQPATGLPEPPLSEDAGPADFLRVAAHALAAGRNGEAQQAMEMAQTRLLDRAVPLGATGTPSEQPVVKLISQALQALASGDRETCLRTIQAARQAVGRP